MRALPAAGAGVWCHAPSLSVPNSRSPFPAFEMTLAEGTKLEKKLFYSTFATVSTQPPQGVPRAPSRVRAVPSLRGVTRAVGERCLGQ